MLIVRSLAVAAFLVCAVQASAHGLASDVRSGGIFRISLSPQAGLDNLDPALSYTPPGWALLDTTCARLMTYPDKPAPAAFRLEPEVAAAPPRVSRDLKTYTFTLRRGFRFSDGSPVRASAFARAINRVLAPALRSPGVVHVRDIVGATDVLAGRSRTARGVEARGYTLIVRFTRAAPGFAARTSLPFFCAVPPTLPAEPEGRAVFPSAGPYHVTEYRPLERVVIRRNRFYGGTRPHRVDGFDVDLRAPSLQEMMQRIERGEADWGSSPAGIFFDPSLGLEAKYGINRSRFFVKPGLTLRMFVFNSSRPLFRNNPRLRKAVNLALDRRALQLPLGMKAAALTDQYLPPALPGFRDADIYPLDRADTARAAELARGNLRGGKAVLYTTDAPPALVPAQLAARQLAAIGLDVEVRRLPVHIATLAYVEQLAAPGAAWDIAFVLYTPNLPDPYAYINLLLDRQFIGRTNLGRFQSRAYEAQMRRAARVPQARGRNGAYAALDARLARDVAPIAAVSVLNEASLVSSRVGCMVFRPMLDLVTVCLK